MKFYKKILCGTLAAAMVLTTAAIPASAAAKPALNKTKLTMTVGNTATLKVKNAAKKEKITWASKKKTVASVTSKGKVTAKKAGKTVVSATLKKAGKTLKCNVTVKAAPAPQEKDITALLAGKSYVGTVDPLGTGTPMEALKLTFGTDGTVTGEMIDPEDLTAKKQIGGTYTATLKDKTVIVTITAPDGAVITKSLTVVKDDFTELSATENVMGTNFPVTVTEVTE